MFPIFYVIILSKSNFSFFSFAGRPFFVKNNTNNMNQTQMTNSPNNMGNNNRRRTNSGKGNMPQSPQDGNLRSPPRRFRGRSRRRPTKGGNNNMNQQRNQQPFLVQATA
jgi:hypothetical protein